MTVTAQDPLKMKFLAELHLAFRKQELRLQIGAMANIMRASALAGYEPFQLLDEALQQYLRPSATNQTKENTITKPGALRCNLCNKLFEKGVHGWNGYKRICTKPCTKQNLI